MLEDGYPSRFHFFLFYYFFFIQATIFFKYIASPVRTSGMREISDGMGFVENTSGIFPIGGQVVGNKEVNIVVSTYLKALV